MFAALYLLTVVMAFVIQTSPWLVTVGSGWRVDLALLVVVYLSLFWPGQRTLMLGFLTGLLQDALSTEVLGLNALSKTVTAFVVQTLCRTAQVHSMIAQGLFTGVAILLDTMGRLSVTFIFQLNTFDLRLILSTFVEQTVVSLCLVPFVYGGLHALAKGLHVGEANSRGYDGLDSWRRPEGRDQGP